VVVDKYMLYISSDHGGFELKESIKEYLAMQNEDVEDMGPETLDTGDDYPDYAAPLAERVAEEEDARGILICRNGIGVCIVANKFKGVRAGYGHSRDSARSQRKDDDTNVLCLPSDELDEDEAMQVLEVWLETSFSNAERHVRRLAKIAALEEENMR
jgi:ribose 5-phosphate isomerase B